MFQLVCPYRYIWFCTHWGLRTTLISLDGSVYSRSVFAVCMCIFAHVDAPTRKTEIYVYGYVRMKVNIALGKACTYIYMYICLGICTSLYVKGIHANTCIHAHKYMWQ